MTQEEKDLLFQDVCTRLAYGLCLYFEKMPANFHLVSIKINNMFPLNDFEVLLNDRYPIQYCKPYLRPLSSMTEEEYKELYTIEKKYYGLAPIDSINDWSPNIETINYLNAHYFDYRGLIDEKGLALEAPRCMYKIAI